MNEKSSSLHPFNILLVEDHADDVLLTKHVFEDLPVAVEFHVARDGGEALEYLRHDGPDANSSLPDLILLDLNMPRMDGRQLLAELKRDERLAMIPTVILSTSAAKNDVCDAYRNHASAYITKPMDLHQFAHSMQCLVDFWLSDVAVLPSRSC